MAANLYRDPDRWGKALILFVCTIPLFFAAGLFVSGKASAPIIFGPALLILGSLGLLYAAALSQLRVIVTDWGIRKSPWLVGGFKASWGAIDSWLVAPSHLSAEQEAKVWSKLYLGEKVVPPFLSLKGRYSVVLFKVREKRRPVVVYYYEACWPSFDAFLQDVRDHASGKEVKEQQSGAGK